MQVYKAQQRDSLTPHIIYHTSFIRALNSSPRASEPLTTHKMKPNMNNRFQLPIRSKIPESQLTEMTPAPRTLPQLPTELWLQILEQTQDPQYLWTVLRSFSPNFNAYVERIFLHTYLPAMSVQPAMPRRDPDTGALRYAHFAPITIFTYSSLSPDKLRVILATAKEAKMGETTHSMESLNELGALSKKRLDDAVLWVSIGCKRAQAVSMYTATTSGTIAWDDEEKVWTWEVDWRELVSKYYDAKKQRSSNRRRG
ncbi:hypothetical protein K504DRAFT_465343 [Pleomassaria siparia CBS 279.74]|uniref:Uncharacterized protein n=1 Tax=Pleomassaria siparia CBS 279.74 TaxID=1314801 RepID=A0A6G1KGR7_9PLEO|nr:hypothetical protein K504DRAFT_465343 [Pleomassaria siparia CBS 279.74]